MVTMAVRHYRNMSVQLAHNIRQWLGIPEMEYALMF